MTNHTTNGQVVTKEAVASMTDSFQDALAEGNIKEAAITGSQFLRTIVRQESLAENIFDGTKKLEMTDLDPSVNTDSPRRIEEIEPDSYASAMQLDGSPRRRWAKARKINIPFGKLASDKQTINKYKQMTYRMDLRAVLTNNQVYDIFDQADKFLFNHIEDLLAQSFATGQALTPAGGLTKENIFLARKKLLGARKRVGKIVMTESLFTDIMALDANDIGYASSDRLFNEGLVSQKSLWGMDFITTIKNDIIPDNVFYMFAPQEFLGYHYTLEHPSLFLKEEADTVEFFTWQVLGMAIAAHDAVVKVTL